MHHHQYPVFLVLLVTSLYLVTSDPAIGKLELIQVLFRNGERTPSPRESYPSDPYQSQQRYTGRLTDVGRYRARRLGRALRLHYEDELTTRKMPRWPDDVYAYSANVDACRESMRHVLEELYNGDRRAAQQVHVKVLPKEADVLMNSRQCSRFKLEADRVRRSAEVQKMLAKYEGLYRYLQEKTGLNFDDDAASVDESLYDLYTLLESQSAMNLTLPDWCPDGVYNLLQEMTFLHHELESHTDQLKRLNGGPLLRRFVDSMKRQTSRSHVHLYAAEARNVAALARAMNKSYPRVPSYGSAIVLEKRRVAAGRLFVRIVVWTGNTEKMFPLQLKDCPENCPMEEFVRRVQASLPADDDMRCLLDDLKNNRS